VKAKQGIQFLRLLGKHGISDDAKDNEMIFKDILDCCVDYLLASNGGNSYEVILLEKNYLINLCNF
jgi:hypothetical protein